MGENMRDLLLTIFGVLFAKVVDVAWDRHQRKREENASRAHGKHSRRQ